MLGRENQEEDRPVKCGVSIKITSRLLSTCMFVHALVHMHDLSVKYRDRNSFSQVVSS